MILPLARIEAELSKRMPGLPDVSARVAGDAHWYANDFPVYQVASGLYERHLIKAGVSRAKALEASFVVHLACSDVRGT